MKWIKKLGLKFQLVLIMIVGVLGAFLFIYFRGNFRIRKQMEYRLNRVRKETQLAELEEDGKEKLQKIEELKKEEKALEEKIEFIKEKEFKGEEVSVEELENFFNDRGF